MVRFVCIVFTVLNVVFVVTRCKRGEQSSTTVAEQKTVPSKTFGELSDERKAAAAREWLNANDENDKRYFRSAVADCELEKVKIFLAAGHRPDDEMYQQALMRSQPQMNTRACEQVFDLIQKRSTGVVNDGNVILATMLEDSRTLDRVLTAGGNPNAVQQESGSHFEGASALIIA